MKDEARAELSSLKTALEDYTTKYPAQGLATASKEDILQQTRERIDLMGRVRDVSTYASLWYNEDLGLLLAVTSSWMSRASRAKSRQR